MSQVDIGYTLSTTTPLGFTEAVARVREELAGEGFGVLCEIDVQATLQAEARRRPRALPDPRRLQPEARPRRAGSRARARRPLPCNVSSTPNTARPTSPPSTPSRCSRSSATTRSPKPRARCAGGWPRSSNEPHRRDRTRMDSRARDHRYADSEFAWTMHPSRRLMPLGRPGAGNVRMPNQQLPLYN